ncbi:MAG: F0F1 ATP synthase subunit A [Actinomycetota bacterium]|nr:F0F1 ATP synthase subunit A [Actinomycetota bacterium]
MNEQVVAAGAVHVGEHDEVQWLGMTFNVDTITATAVAAVIVIALAFFLRAKVTSTDVPGGVQLFFEAITIQMRNQVESAIGIRIAPFVLPLAVTLFVFILIANWLSVLPVQYSTGGEAHELLAPPASDINFALALALFVFICYHTAGVWRRGFFRHIWQTIKGHFWPMFLINIIEEVAKPISLSLRLFGNLFAGGILVTLIAALIPAQFMWAPNAIWKLFDLFVGLIQAFIFALLTILYFSQSMELEHDDEKHDDEKHDDEKQEQEAHH